MQTSQLFEKQAEKRSLTFSYIDLFIWLRVVKNNDAARSQNKNDKLPRVYSRWITKTTHDAAAAAAATENNAWFIFQSSHTRCDTSYLHGWRNQAVKCN